MTPAAEDDAFLLLLLLPLRCLGLALALRSLFLLCFFDDDDDETNLLTAQTVARALANPNKKCFDGEEDAISDFGIERW